MVMIRPGGKPQKVAEQVMKGKGVKIPKKKKTKNKGETYKGRYGEFD